jgi:uncharacterized RDD family membrane protein YckC
MRMSTPLPWSDAPIPATDAALPSYELAGWWARVGAVLLDALVLLVPVIVLALVLHDYSVVHSNGSVNVSFGYTWVSTLLWVFYSLLLLSRAHVHNGQTLGKQGAGLRIVRNGGQPMDWRTALLREGVGKAGPGLLAAAVPVLALIAGPYLILNYLWPLWDREHRALHDHLTGTHVVRTQRQQFAPGSGDTFTPTPSPPPPATDTWGTPQPLVSTSAAMTSLAQLPEGPPGFAALGVLVRDAEGGCWIEASALLAASADTFHPVCIQRGPAGLHATVPGATLVPTSTVSAAAYAEAGYEPVVSVSFL